MLIVDDLGLRGLSQDEPADLHEIVRHRYERGSTSITSNRAIEEWPQSSRPLSVGTVSTSIPGPA